MDINFDWQSAAQIAGAAVTAGVALAGFITGPGALRNRLKGDIELLGGIPAESAAYESLLGHIEHQVKTIETLDKSASRDASGAVIGALLAIGLGWLGFFLFETDGEPWGWPIWAWVWTGLGVFSLICAAACLSNMFDALQRVPRDENDKPI